MFLLQNNNLNVIDFFSCKKAITLSGILALVGVIKAYKNSRSREIDRETNK